MPTERAPTRAQKDQREDKSAIVPEQVIANGLSQARRAGIDFPETRAGKATRTKPTAKKRSASKAAAKKRAANTPAGSRAAGAVRAARTRAMRSRSR